MLQIRNTFWKSLQRGHWDFWGMTYPVLHMFLQGDADLAKRIRKTRTRKVCVRMTAAMEEILEARMAKPAFWHSRQAVFRQSPVVFSQIMTGFVFWYFGVLTVQCFGILVLWHFSAFVFLYLCIQKNGSRI